MGYICVVMRATHGMPDTQYVSFIQHVFYTWKQSVIFPNVKIILNKEKHWAVFL
jgi:hypothetical protein